MLRDRLLKKEVDIGLQPRHLEMVKGWNNNFTPDIYKLGKYQHQLVFVYDQFMSDRRQHFVIEDYVVENVTAFTLLHFDLLLAPEGQVLPIRRSAEMGGMKVKGEILQLKQPDTAMSILDKMYQRGVQFYRQRVLVLDPYRPYRIFENGGTEEHPNDTYWADGTVMPAALQGRKLDLGDEHVEKQSVWMYLPNPDYWDWMIKRRPEIFHRVPHFTPKKEKTWLSEYFQYQNENS